MNPELLDQIVVIANDFAPGNLGSLAEGLSEANTMNDVQKLAQTLHLVVGGLPRIRPRLGRAKVGVDLGLGVSQNNEECFVVDEVLARRCSMAEVMDKPVESQHQAAARRFTSPNRILARSFRLSRDKWKQKHHQVQAKLEQTRQLAAERGIARDRWRERCEQATARAATAEASAARLQGELEQARTRIAALEAALQEKRADAARSGPE